MFELLTPTRMKVRNASPRKEQHGEDLVQAIDVDIDWEASQDALDMFGRHLLDSMYYRDGATEAQADVPGIPSIKPDLRNPLMQMPIKWELELKGRDFRIDHGLGGKSDLVLSTSKVKKFSFTIKQGGSVVVHFQVQCNTDVSEKVVGKLCALEGQFVEATLTTSDGADEDEEPGGQREIGDEPPAPSRKPAAAERAAVAKAEAQAVKIEQSQPGTRTARGRDATAKFIAAHTNGEASAS